MNFHASIWSFKNHTLESFFKTSMVFYVLPSVLYEKCDVERDAFDTIAPYKMGCSPYFYVERDQICRSLFLFK